MNTPHPAQPFVSVIMPIRNEADFIARSLGAVLSQDYPHERMEVFIADGMSIDATREIIRQTAAEYPATPVTIVDNPGQIVPTGFNLALRQARGKIVVRVDGHTIIAPDYVRQCVEALDRTGANNVGGRMAPVSETPLGAAAALATSFPFGVGGGRFHYSQQEEWVDTVYMGAWPKAVFDRVGLFDEEFVRNQDDEFNYRLRAHGGRILLSPQIKSRYYNRSTLRSLWRQYFQYGCWKVRVLQKHPRQMSLRQFVPVAFVGALLGTGVLGLLFSPIWLLFALVLGAYVLANLAASVWLSLRHGFAHLPLLPIVFATLHVSYGAGFLWGIARFRNYWFESVYDNGN